VQIHHWFLWCQAPNFRFSLRFTIFGWEHSSFPAKRTMGTHGFCLGLSGFVGYPISSHG
jgi:hypothetical protein